MNANDISTILIASGGFLVVLGGGAKWLLSRMDAKNVTAAAAELQARTALSEQLQLEISHLRDEVASLRQLNAVYHKRIYQLENFIHGLPGVEIPLMDGWPPA